MTAASVALPALPSLRVLTSQLRDLNEAFAHPEGGPEYVVLVNAGPEVGWVLECPQHPDGIGCEWVPGVQYFDATAAARRLLAAARDAGFR